MRFNVLFITMFTLALIGPASPVSAAESDLLNNVKRNPEKAKAMCRSFQQMNANDKSAYSKETTAKVANSEGLSFQDAEILVTYVVGMHCSDVR